MCTGVLYSECLLCSQSRGCGTALSDIRWQCQQPEQLHLALRAYPHNPLQTIGLGILISKGSVTVTCLAVLVGHL